MRCLFFMLGIVDSARFTPRGALRHEPPFGADAPLMQVNLPVPLLNESTSSAYYGGFRTTCFGAGRFAEKFHKVALSPVSLLI